MVVALLALSACGAQRTGPLQFGGATMGTTYSISLPALPAGVDEPAVREGVVEILWQVDSAMSTWRRDSAVSRFNRADGGRWFAVPPALAEVVALALEVTRLTGGGFDITVGSLVDLWGFGPDLRPERVPTQEQVKQARGVSGVRHLQIRSEPPALKKAQDQLHIDLSAIAKGYAVDQVADWLAAQGVADYLVEVGGEIRVAGHNADGVPWRVAVERPGQGAREALAVLSVSDRAVATSGDYRNFFERDGKRYPHAIDPVTGHPVQHGLASVTVVAASAARADALATGLLVLGPRAGYQLAERERLAVLFIERRGDELVPHWTPGFMHAVAGVEGLDDGDQTLDATR